MKINLSMNLTNPNPQKFYRQLWVGPVAWLTMMIHCVNLLDNWYLSQTTTQDSEIPTFMLIKF